MDGETHSWRILVVDDEPNIRAALVRALNLLSYHADGVESGRAALAQLAQREYALMLLDIAMPGMDGAEVMHQVRALGSDISIIILTGNATLDSAIAAVKTGADEYLIKPASIEQVAQAVANAFKKRIEQWRRQQLVRTALQALQEAEHPDGSGAPVAPPQPRDESPVPAAVPIPMLCVGGLRLDGEKRLAIVEDDQLRTVELTEGEAKILAALMQHPDEVLSCRDLAQMVWNYDVDENEARSLVRPYIFRLRHKLEKAPNEPRWIHTVRERGYMLPNPE